MLLKAIVLASEHHWARTPRGKRSSATDPPLAMHWPSLAHSSWPAEIVHLYYRRYPIILDPRCFELNSLIWNILALPAASTELEVTEALRLHRSDQPAVIAATNSARHKIGTLDRQIAARESHTFIAIRRFDYADARNPIEQHWVAVLPLPVLHFLFIICISFCIWLWCSIGTIKVSVPTVVSTQWIPLLHPLRHLLAECL